MDTNELYDALYAYYRYKGYKVKNFDLRDFLEWLRSVNDVK